MVYGFVQPCMSIQGCFLRNNQFDVIRRYTLYAFKFLPLTNFMATKILPHGGRKNKGAVNEYGLTASEEAFCNAYLVRFSIAKAEKELGLSKGTGTKYMAKLKVRERITALRIETGKTFDITKERILQELMNIVYGDSKTLLKNDDIVKWPDDDLAAISSVEFSLLGKVAKFKRWDKLKAIEILNRMLGYNMPDVTKVIPATNEPISKEEILEISKALNDAV